MDVQDFLIQGEGREEDKREAWELFQKAYQQQMKGELEEAVSLYRQSLAAHPTAEAHTFLGWTYSFMGRLNDAIEDGRLKRGDRLLLASVGAGFTVGAVLVRWGLN